MRSAGGAVPREDTRVEGWRVIHENLCRLAARRGAADVEEAKWLLAGLKARVHEPLGFGSFLEYVERVLGYTPKVGAERIRVAQAFAELPALCESVTRGELSWSAAREVSRVAVPETVDAWIEECLDERVRDVERFVAGRKPGDLPTDPPDDAVRTHVVRFEVSGETLALLREAQTTLTVEAGGHVDDDRLVERLARAVLRGGEDPGRAAYQLVVHACPRCGAAHAEGGGERVAVDATVAEMARCDAQVVTLEPATLEPVTLEPATLEPVTLGPATLEPATLGPATLGPATLAPAEGSGAPSSSEESACAEELGCESTHPHVGARPAPTPGPAAARPRATQTIPPATRREVVRRHGGRCAVPGCRHAGFLHQHHTHRRADGGTHDPDKLLLLCTAHHRGTHEGYLVIEGRWSTGFTFHHADGTPYGRRRRAGGGRPPEEPTEQDSVRGGWTSITRQSRLAAATRHLRACGVPEHEAAALVRAVAAELAGEDSLPAVVDAALRRWAASSAAGRA